MKRLFFSVLFICLASFGFSQQKPITLIAGVTVQTNFPDSVAVDTFYEFQLLGSQGKIANIKTKLSYGVFEQLSENKYRVKISPNDKLLELTFTKYDPMSKSTKILKVITVPVKK